MFCLSCSDLPNHVALFVSSESSQWIEVYWLGLRLFGLRLFGVTVWKLLIIDPFSQWKLNKIETENCIEIWNFVHENKSSWTTSHYKHNMRLSFAQCFWLNPSDNVRKKVLHILSIKERCKCKMSKMKGKTHVQSSFTISKLAFWRFASMFYFSSFWSGNSGIFFCWKKPCFSNIFHKITKVTKPQNNN